MKIFFTVEEKMKKKEVPVLADPGGTIYIVVVVGVVNPVEDEPYGLGDPQDN